MDTSDIADIQTSAGVAAAYATEAAEAKATAPVNLEVKVTDDITVPALVTRQGATVHNLSHLLPAPQRQRGTVHLLNLQNLHGYLARFAGPGAQHGYNPVVYANRSNLSFTAILNHPTADKPEAWMDNRAVVTLAISQKLKVWMDKNEKKFTQEEFALFLEENVEDIREPDSAAVLTFAQTLEATLTNTFKSSIRSSTGECTLHYTSERSGEGNTALIEEIQIGVPLFEGGESYAVTLKIFHRVTDAKLSFWFKIMHLQHILDAAWVDLVKFLSTAVGELAPVYDGVAPEAQRPLELLTNPR